MDGFGGSFNTSAFGGDLGGAAFTLRVDSQNFEQGLTQAKASAESASQEIAESFKKTEDAAEEAGRGIGDFFEQITGGGGKGGKGLLQLSYLLDDLQYGFKGILNNIPQLTSAIGGSAGLAGALGIAAVAAYQLYANWDQLKEAVLSTDLKQGLDLYKEDADREKNAAINRALDNLDPDAYWKATGGGKSNHELNPYTRDDIAKLRQERDVKRAEEFKAYRDSLPRDLPKGEDETLRAEEVAAALKNLPGGGEGLVQRLFNAQIGKGGNQNQIELDKRIRGQVKDALSGREMDLSVLGPEFNEALEQVRSDKAVALLMKEGKAGEKEMTALERANAKADAKYIDDLNRQGKENERATKAKHQADLKADRERELAQARETRIGEELMKRQVRDNIDSLKEQRDAIRDRMAEQRPASIFSDTRSFLESRQLGVLNDKSPEVKELKDINKKLDEQTKALRNINTARLA